MGRNSHDCWFDSCPGSLTELGSIIGSGIFASPGPVLEHAESVGNALLVWVFAGLLAMTGGLCYAELGTMIPESGGDHPYLLRAFGQLPAFLFSWTGILAARPGSIAIISTTAAEYTGRLFNAKTLYPWVTKLVAIFYTCVLSGINILSTNASTGFQTLMTLLKVLSLSLIGSYGIFTLIIGKPSSTFDNGIFVESDFNPGSFSLAMYSALWAYDGWNSLNAVTGELQDPSKNLPRSIIGGLSLVILCYFTTNLAYYAVLPAETIKTSTTIGLDFGKIAFGSIGMIIIPIIVIISTLGVTCGNRSESNTF